MESNYSNIKKDLEYSTKLQSLDMYENYSYEQKVSHCIDDCFNLSIKQYEQRDTRLLKCIGLYGDVLRNRKKAIKNALKLVKEKYQDKYPDIDVEFEYISYNSDVSFSNYDEINNHDFIFEAAAILILYEVENYGGINELLKILPKDEEKISLALVHPEANDMTFSDDVIRSLVSVFQDFFSYDYKNDDQIILTRKYSTKNPKELKNYELLEKIFSLMNEDVIDIMVNSFKKDFERILEMVFDAASYYQKIINNNHKQQLELLKKVKNQDNNNRSLFSNDLDILSNLQMFDCVNQIEESIELNGDLINAKHLFRMALNFIYEDDSIANEELEDFLKEKLFSFEIADPFETCFSFVYLLFKKDDLIWHINPCMSLLKIAAEKLPWNKDFNFARDNNENEQKAIEERLSKYENVTPEKNREDNISFVEKCRKGESNIYKQIYNDSWRWENIENANNGKDLVKWNLAQLIFDYTSYIIPRNMSYYDSKREKGLLLSGFKKDEIHLINLLMNTYGSIGIQNTFDNNIEIDKDDIEENIDDLKTTINKKTTQITNLKKELNESRIKFNKLKKEVDNIKNQNIASNNELAQLRELVYNLQSNSFDENEEIKISFNLPYTPKCKTIIIGGTDNWINKFKEKLNNVAFLSSKANLNEDLLKTADVIWIQTIALKHADFYNLSNYSAKRNIPMNYFSYSNINKCLTQLIEKDNELAKR